MEEYYPWETDVSLFPWRNWPESPILEIWQSFSCLGVGGTCCCQIFVRLHSVGHGILVVGDGGWHPRPHHAATVPGNHLLYNYRHGESSRLHQFHPHLQSQKLDDRKSPFGLLLANHVIEKGSTQHWYSLAHFLYGQGAVFCRFTFDYDPLFVFCAKQWTQSMRELHPGLSVWPSVQTTTHHTLLERSRWLRLGVEHTWTKLFFFPDWSCPIDLQEEWWATEHQPCRPSWVSGYSAEVSGKQYL